MLSWALGLARASRRTPCPHSRTSSSLTLPNLQQRLLQAGITPKDCVVDVTHYVMLHIGQPMHAFDAQCIQGDTLFVRHMQDKQQLTLLDGQEVEVMMFDGQPVMVELPIAVELSGNEAYEDSQSAFLQDLRFQPGPTGTPDRKIEWTSRKQQQAYFASDGFGGGIPSTRSGGLSKAWQLEAESVGDLWQVFVRNPFVAARFVYGSLALSNPRAAARFQQEFHRITGWPLAVFLVLDWFELLQDQFTINMNILIDSLGTPEFKQRGFTPRLPKKRRT